MNNMPFSVAISVYKNDNPEFFDSALYSITELQTLVPDEIVLVVDGPVAEEIETIIQKYSAKYNFNVIRLEQNRGLGNALKIATESARNELIARMDSDDVSVSNRFEQQINLFIQNPNVDIVGGDITEFIEDETNIVSERKVPQEDCEIKKYMKKRCAMNHVSVMFKRTSVLKAGGYLDWFWNEDYYLWIRMCLNSSVFQNTGTVLVNVRTGKDMYSRRGGKKYFISEIKLQLFMFKNQMINVFELIDNCTKRFIIQVLLPNKVRGFVFRKFARTEVK